MPKTPIEPRSRQRTGKALSTGKATKTEIKKLAASALTQAPNKKKK